MLAKGYDVGRSKQAPFPFVRKVTVDVIANAGNKLWKELVGTSTTIIVNYVALAFTGIDIAEQGQKSIEGFLKPASASTPKKRLWDEEQSVPADFETAMTEDNREEDTLLDVQIHERQSSNRVLSWTCSRCGKAFGLPEHMSNADDNTQRAALSNIQLEHEDFHFAEELMKESEERVSPVKPTSKTAGFKPGTAKKKSRKELQGLDKYFSKK